MKFKDLLTEDKAFEKEMDAKYKLLKKALKEKDEYDSVPDIENLIKVLQKQVDKLV